MIAVAAAGAIAGLTGIASGAEERVIAPADQMDTVYSSYCARAPVIAYKKTDYSVAHVKQLAGLKIDALVNNLAGNAYPADKLPEALNAFGGKLIMDNRFDDGYKIFACAAEKYYDMSAMYKMAMLYKHGSDAYKEQFPTALIAAPVKRDYEKAYFWIGSMMYVEMAEKTGRISAETQTGWNAIAMLDDLQNTSKVPAKDQVSIEKEVRVFIAKRYPEILTVSR